MITIDKYLNNPTKTLHCTYNQYKTRALKKNEVIVSCDKYREEDYLDYFDSKIMRMKHDLHNLTSSKINKNLSFKSSTFEPYEDENKYFIDDLYTLMKEISLVSDEDFDHITKVIKDNNYDTELCFILYTAKPYRSISQKRKRYPVGFCYATLDKTIGEATIEAFGIIPELRKKGYAKIIIEELLLRLANLDAVFMTVQFPLYDDHILEKLFKDCGFTDEYVWHILKKNSFF